MFGIPKAIDDNANNTSTSALELNLNAGSRSLFMLSKISDYTCHGKIQEHYGTQIIAPESPQDHWALFVDIAKQSKCPWRCEIIYFSRKWINKLKNDEWAVLAKRLMTLHRASYSIWHKVSDVWNKTFQEIEREKKLITYYSVPSLTVAKQLFMLAANITPGFRPATNDDSAPIILITDAYTTVYPKLTQQKQSVVIMEAAKFDMQKNAPIYYSINLSAGTQKDLKASKKKSQISLLDEIRLVAETYSKTILEDKENVPSLYDVANKTQFLYYHSNPENYTKICNAALLATEDRRFTGGNLETFPVTSLFFKGCIKVSRAR